MIRASYDDRIVVEGERLARIVTATWGKSRRHKEGSVEVYKIYDDGTDFCKHLCFSVYSGYLVDDRYLDEDEWDEPAFFLHSFRDSYSSELTDADRETLISENPEFKWTLQKYGKCTKAMAMNLLIAWKKKPKIELLVSAKLYNILFDGNFAKMTADKQKQVLGFIRENECTKSWPLQKILFVMNRKGTEKDYEDWNEFRDRSGKIVGFKFFTKYRDKLVTKNGKNYALVDFYRDYMRMAEAVGHDIRDNYWKYPNDIKKAHDKVLGEYEAMLEAQRIEQLKAKNRRERNKKKNFDKVAERFSKLTLRKSGLVVHVPKDLKEIREQAKALHQCLVYCDYYGSMAERELLLVFITNDEGKPVATAEIMPNLKVGQFYADQRKYDDDLMKPSADAVFALNEWIEKFREPLLKNFKSVA